MKHVVLSLVLCAGVLPACTTVEITNSGMPSSVSYASSKDSTLLKRTAQRLSSLFETKGWCEVRDEDTHQSAAQILLEGLKSGDDLATPSRDYASGSLNTSDLIRDISIASGHVEQTTGLARRVLAEDTDIKLIADELTLLEKALISARQAEDTFRVALEGRGTVAASEFERYSDNVNDLRAVTDAFGDRMRGQSAIGANG